MKDSAPAAAPLRDAFERLRRARDTALAPRYEERIAALAAIESMLREGSGELCEAVDADFEGRAAQETRLLEIFPGLESARHARRHLRAWMRPQRRATSKWFMPGRSRVMRQPLGVVGIVVPWNYPVYLAIGPVVSALAAGNRVLVKMSEAAPRTGELLARLVAARFDPALLAIVNGGPEVGREFVSLAFDHLLFTGSTEVGREVMRAAAGNLTPVTLELGGKSPAIVGRGIDVAEAAGKIMFGKCLNAGQTCIAPDYALVPEGEIEAFVTASRGAVARMYPRLVDNPQYTSIVNARHRERLRSLLDEARRMGARVEEINPAAEDFSGSPKMAPHLVVSPPAGARVMREEIFGPILPVVPYRELDEAIAYVNARPRPLALYVFDRDSAAISRVLEETISGGVTVNETILHIAQDDLPFGGVGASGMGEYHGRAGFETFSKGKAVFHQPRWNLLGLFRPPYGPRFERLMRLLAR
ncbi:MAG: coniferyl aldehyde dehydrogenase [Burkholderiales bacterium]|nr:coniferyl aldehyde dehydrogenase [Burkholderiales bacterium]